MYVQVGRPDGGFSTPATSASAPLLSAVVDPVPRAFHHPGGLRFGRRVLRVDVAGEIGLSRRPVLAEILVHGLDGVAAIGVEPEPVDRARRGRGALRALASVGALGAL